MHRKFTVSANQDKNLFKWTGHKGSAVTIEFDFSPWAEDNNSVTTATWTVKAGNAGVSGQALVSNVASALVTLSELGKSLIEVKADTGTEIFVVMLEVYASEPYKYGLDYGLYI